MTDCMCGWNSLDLCDQCEAELVELFGGPAEDGDDDQDEDDEIDALFAELGNPVG